MTNIHILNVHKYLLILNHSLDIPINKKDIYYKGFEKSDVNVTRFRAKHVGKRRYANT